jgi:hypothetical protein
MKFVEVAVPDDFEDRKRRIVIEGEGASCPSVPAVGPALPGNRAELEAVLISFVDDVELAFGSPGEEKIDEDRLDWPNLADPYRQARALLAPRFKG